MTGIWPEGADGTDINACCRSNNHEYLVTGDDFGQVNFFNYPSTKPKVLNVIRTLLHPFGENGHKMNLVFGFPATQPFALNLLTVDSPLMHSL